MNTYNEDMPLSSLYESEEVSSKVAPDKIPDYEPTQWVDETEPDIDAEHLNHIEQGIKGVTDLANSTAGAVSDLQSQLDNMGGGGTVPENVLTKSDLANNLDTEVAAGEKAVDAALLPQIKQAIESGGGAPSGGYVFVEPETSEEGIPPVSEPMLDADALGGQAASHYAPQSQITDAFSEDKAYTVGQYCIYLNRLYKFAEAKAEGPWDESKVEACTVLGEIGALKLSFLVVTPINIDSVVDTHTTLSDTGIKFTIPANSAYCVSATARYNASPPKGIAIKRIKDGAEDNNYFSAQNDSESDRISVSVSGYAFEAVEFTVMARYTNAGKNRILVSGFYISAKH